MHICGIYGICNIKNDKWYIGQAQDIAKRWYTERHSLLKYGRLHPASSNDHFDHSWKKYGSGAFVWLVLEVCPVEILDEREKFWIIEKDSFCNGYNLTEGGGGLRGWTASEDTRKRQSEAHLGRMVTNEERRKHSESMRGEKHHNYGKQLPKETKMKLSEAMKGKFVGKNHPMYGKKHTVETRQKMSMSHIGKQAGEKHPFYGKPAHNRGKHHTEESISKMSKSHKGKQMGAANPSAKKIIQYTTSGDFVRKWDSMIDVTRELKINRCSLYFCCTGKQKTAGGFVWKYATDI